MEVNHYLVIDLEATCSEDGAVPRDEMEIIEIGAVMASAATLGPIAEFQSFVRPVRHPALTDFCRELTGIAQAQVDAAPGFVEALAGLVDWAGAFSNWVFCSWGEYDRQQFEQDCAYHGVAYPLGDRHVNLKAEFAHMQHSRKKGVVAALRAVGLSFEGSHHRGIDDARNIVRLLPFIFPPKGPAPG